MAARPAPGPPGAGFRKLFIGQSLSYVGDRIAPIALAFGVLGIGGSAAELGLVIAAGTIPFSVFTLAAGVWADRLPRQRLMLASDVVRAAVQALTGALLLAGAAEVWMLAALAVIYGTADAFFSPAMNGLVPQTISSARLQEANALLGGTRSSAIVIGPAIAGVLIAIADPGGAILLDAATFLVSAAFLARLRLAPVESRGGALVPGGAARRLARGRCALVGLERARRHGRLPRHRAAGRVRARPGARRRASSTARPAGRSSPAASASARWSASC